MRHQKSPPAVEALDLTNPPTAPVLFRRKPQKKLKSGVQPLLNHPPKRTTGSAVIAAAPDNDTAQFAEDAEQRANNFDTWNAPWYTLCFEEADVVADMLTQMSKVLDLGAVVLADQGNNLTSLFERVNWSKVQCSQDILVSTVTPEP
jgi:hypothetical protein